MLWSFIAVCFSAWLYVDASYRGPAWQRWLFKPVTLLLLLLMAWQAPMLSAVSYLVLAGLCASLIGDALTLLSRQQQLYAVGAFFLSHLLYTIYFASQMTLSFFWPLPLVLLIIGALLLATIWSRLEALRLPVSTFIAITLVMVWLAGELWFFLPSGPALSAFCGAVLLLIGNVVWLFSHYRRRFKADNAISAACYFIGHFLIVRSLYL
ncbi:putative membrane protein YhhN [Enterobacter sp. BIGb0383]|uniref:lysoplasmalogenase n=1 Tax=unclassified Enterobacter TaxID=2608935 RepID=UPI000F49ABCB|nr:MULTISPECIES: lysoplasmalogenase [unclassified Enterobacter]ROP56367.1 putative membrane protein YhhN [Enterobacter sp. BIGb0383]ROS04433.1 putative membrane protein YhhN [Enterobacter sp. BIGb0359]